MALEARIASDIIIAQKAKEAFRLETLRLLMSQVKNRAIEKRGSGSPDSLTDAEVVEVLHREAKKRREAIEVYARGGRADLAKKEEQELAIVTEYLPAQMSRDEVAAAVKAIAAKNPGGFTALMKATMAELKGRADGKLVSEVVKEATQ
jgi:uncharacterized protein YqeY